MLLAAHVPSTNVEDVYQEVLEANLPVIGSLRDPKHFYWPTTPEQAMDIFENLAGTLFPNFSGIFKTQ